MKEHIDIVLNRGYDSGESTVGIINTPKSMFTTLEDTWRPKKIKGVTRIKDGYYQLRFRKILSPKTKIYRKRYNWFKWHLELQNVPEFATVYLHIGNYAKNTDGCILIGKTIDRTKPDYIGSSLVAFKAFYEEISGYLNKGADVWLRIKNEW